MSYNFCIFIYQQLNCIFQFLSLWLSSHNNNPRAASPLIQPVTMVGSASGEPSAPAESGFPRAGGRTRFCCWENPSRALRDAPAKGAKQILNLFSKAGGLCAGCAVPRVSSCGHRWGQEHRDPPGSAAFLAARSHLHNHHLIPHRQTHTCQRSGFLRIS